MNLWLFTTISQLCVAGAGGGIGMMIYGYANLFLEKQAVFEQHINEQMNVLANASNVGSLQISRERATMGDQFNIKGDVTGAAVGRGASLVANQISIIKNTIDTSKHLHPQVKEVLLSATNEVDKLPLSEADKEDVAENLKKCASELDKPAPEASRVVRFVRRIEELAPSIALILKSATTIAGFFTM